MSNPKPNPITIGGVTLAGFRAYLKSQSFPLLRDSKPISLAIFAPNAKGKSSLIDAIEFYFSEKGTLERLGEKSSGTKAGRQPLINNKSKEHNITPEVAFAFNQGGKGFGDSREVSIQTPKPRTNAANTIMAARQVDFIVRGHELRRFVEGQTPEERYEQVSHWFGLTPLTTIQSNLRSLRTKVKGVIEKNPVLKARQEDLKKATGGRLANYSEEDICEWFSTNYLQPLDKTLKLAHLNKTHATYLELVKRKDEEEKAVGLDVLKQTAQALVAVHAQTEEKLSGAIVSLEGAAQIYADAANKEAQERLKAEKAAFKDLWEKANAIFADKTVTVENCPVCTTSLDKTPLGTREQGHSHLTAELGKLTDYRNAVGAKDSALTNQTGALSKLKNALSALVPLLSAAKETATEKVVVDFQTAINGWSIGAALPDSSTAKAAILALSASIAARRKEIEQRQGDKTYAKALIKADELIVAHDNLLLAQKTHAELEKLQKSLNDLSASIGREIAAHVKKMLDQLTSSINVVFGKIQGPGAVVPKIALELPSEEDVAQQRLNLFIDFDEDRKSVVPAGYFSDSQIHTLALSLRLSAMRLFNSAFPVVALDDVVTSYDADHRKAIAATLASDFSDFQIVIVTHDELFYNYLRDHLPAKSWSFKQITKLDESYGPRYVGHRLADEVIEQLLENGDTAANEIRQSEEEWLLEMCRGFGVDIRIREVSRVFNYGRAELASALGKFLKEKGLVPPLIPGISNPFLQTLQAGTFENFGSHFSDNPNATLSNGDAKQRWSEFKYFRDLFKCEACGRAAFHRPETSRLPLCKHDKCGVSLSFPQPVTAQTAG